MGEKKRDRQSSDASSLRQRAEAWISANPPGELAQAPGDVRSLVYELSVHQAELEIQNEELRDAQVELAEARDRYADLYEFAPVGYLSLDHDSVIRAANLTAAKLLERWRSELIGQKLSRFVTRESQDSLHRYWCEIRDPSKRADCEVQITRPGRSPLAAQLDRVVRSIESADGIAASDVAEIRLTVTDISRRKQAEDALQDLNQDLERRIDEHTAEIRLQANAIANLSEGVLITADHVNWPAAEIIFVNEAMCGIAGYTAGELVGQLPVILWGEESDPETLDHVRRELAANRPCRVEQVYHRKDGTPYDVEVFITPLFDADNRRTNFVSVHRDITQRKAAEGALRESERAHVTLVNNLPGAAFRCKNDRDWTVLYISDGIAELTGYGGREFLDGGRSMRELIHDEDQERLWVEIQSAVKKKQPYQVVYRLVGRDGVARTIWEKGEGVFADSGELVALEGFISDISELKQAEEALRNLSEFNENLIATAQNVILVLSPDGRVVSFNPAFEKLSGWTMAEAEGCDWVKSFIAKRDRRQIRRFLAAAIHREPSVGKVIPILTKGGEERVIEWRQAVLSAPDDTILGLLCTGTDVTDRLRLEQEVINASEKERQRIAHDLHDELGSHLAGTELRLKTLAMDLSERGDVGGTADCRKIQVFLQDAIGKTRSIAQGLNPVGGHSDDLKSSLEEMVGRAEDASDASCQLRCPEGILIQDPILANHLFQIAQEAVNNAMKYSGAKRITVSLAHRGDQIVLKVTDNGIGFDQDEHGRGGLGLHIMGYRANAIGGTLNISRRGSGGTKVVCRVSPGGGAPPS